MADSGEWSRGSRVVRHAAPGGAEDAPTPAHDARSAVVQHLTRHVGPVSRVLRSGVHDERAAATELEVNAVAPARASRPRAWTLYTVGMSERDMAVPRDFDVPHRAELMMRLPATWSFDGRGEGDTSADWPIRWLRRLARLPHELDTWLGPGHTVPNGDPARPLGPGTKQCCILVMPPLFLPPAARVVHAPQGEAIALYTLYPLYADEMELKLREGFPSLRERLEKAGVRDVVDPVRAHVTTRAKLFGIF